MPTKKLTKEDLFRYAILYAALVFCLFSLVFFSIKGESGKTFMSAISILYVFVPSIAQKIFRFRIQNVLYVFVMLYTVCPLLGYSYNLYYTISWWDDILHSFAGFVFAMLGAYLPKVMCKKGEAPLSLCVFSAFFFSVAVAGLWELVEFSMDTFFATDMQKDTLLYSMRPSYLLSEMLGFPVGELGELRDAQMIVNGQTMDYYVDLGLIDSMKDIFVETLGAAVYTVIFRAGKGKHFTFEPIAEEKTQVASEEGAPNEENGEPILEETAASEPPLR